jgi:dCMP deaminase
MKNKRPDWDSYFMKIAEVVSTRSNCLRRSVGAIIVKDKVIVSTGYNGTPFGVKNCFDGGCKRCMSDQPPGQGYDTCICVHAEGNAITLAARNGASTSGSAVYTTLRPCFSCLKELIQSGVKEIVFKEDCPYKGEMEEAYQDLVKESGIVLRQLK